MFRLWFSWKGRKSGRLTGSEAFIEEAQGHEGTDEDEDRMEEFGLGRRFATHLKQTQMRVSLDKC